MYDKAMRENFASVSLTIATSVLLRKPSPNSRFIVENMDSTLER
jgi:hypothetical protein